VIALETDRNVTADLRGNHLTVKAHSPVLLSANNAGH
jgi:hypothetical protein